MNIIISGRITKRDYRKTTKTVYDRFYKPYRIIVLVTFLVCIIFFIAKVLLFNETLEFPPIENLIIFLIIMTTPWWLPLFFCWSKFNHALKSDHVINGIISEEKITFKTGESDGIMPWNAITGFWLKEDFLILFYKWNRFLPLPKSVFDSDQDWNELISFLNNRYPK